MTSKPTVFSALVSVFPLHMSIPNTKPSNEQAGMGEWIRVTDTRAEITVGSPVISASDLLVQIWQVLSLSEGGGGCWSHKDGWAHALSKHLQPDVCVCVCEGGGGGVGSLWKRV